MQAVILAAGKSSRFYPFNTVHKSCVLMLGKTIIEHTVDAVKRAGISDIIVVTSSDGFIENLLSKRTDVALAFVPQDLPDGGGSAILQAKKHIKGDFFVLNANRVEFSDLAEKMLSKKNDENAVLLAKESNSLNGFGVLEITDGKVTGIVEKPEAGKEPSNLKVIGVYLFPKTFLQVLENEKKDHYSLENAITAFAKTQNVSYALTTEETTSLKYAWDLFSLKDYFLAQLKPFTSSSAKIAKSATISGSVVIEDGATIMDHATVLGPCYIGKNAYIGTNAILRNGIVVEAGSAVGANMEIKNSLIGENTTTHSGFIGDSLIGRECKIAAFFCTANVRIDRKMVGVAFGDKKIDTGKKDLGVIMGEGVSVGIRSSTMPGVVIGNNCIIGPHTAVMHNVTDNKKYFTKFTETVEESI